jgi:hypothetical protein
MNKSPLLRIIPRKVRNCTEHFKDSLDDIFQGVELKIKDII